MSKSTRPWTLEAQEPKSLKSKRAEIQQKELQSKAVESLPVSTARVVKFLNKHKNQTYTNREIAAEVGLSGSTVSGIMDKLEEIGCVKVAKIRKSATSGISQVYQSYDGSSAKVEKEREVEGYIVRVLEVFNKSVNKVYSKKVIASELGISANNVGQALSILLVTGKIKVVGNQDRVPVYQNIKGNKPKIDVTSEPDKNYMTLNNYLQMNEIKADIKALKQKIASEKGHARLFQSDQGLIKEYEVSYLQKIAKPLKKKEGGIIGKLKAWSMK